MPRRDVVITMLGIIVATVLIAVGTVLSELSHCKQTRVCPKQLKAQWEGTQPPIQIVAPTTLPPTTLDVAITSTSDKIVLARTIGIKVGMFVLVDQELMKINTVSRSWLGIVRGLNGTIASAHFFGATVYIFQPSMKGEIVYECKAARKAGRD